MRIETPCVAALILRDGQEAAPQSLPENTDLILRSLRSKRLEGWAQGTDSRPSFETPDRTAQVRCRESGLLQDEGPAAERSPCISSMFSRIASLLRRNRITPRQSLPVVNA